MRTRTFFLTAVGIAAAGILTTTAQNPGTPANPSGAAGTAQGQNQRGTSAPGRIVDEENTTGRWDCSLPGGNFTISLGKILGTSIHQYVVPTPTTTASPVPLPTRVHEVNIATDGALVVRFYFVESATDASMLNVTQTALARVNQVANEAANRAGTVKPWQMVQKDYPMSTHAHTVEFRVETLDDLHRLYGSVKRSWITGKGAAFSVRGE